MCSYMTITKEIGQWFYNYDYGSSFLYPQDTYITIHRKDCNVRTEKYSKPVQLQ
jgi:hypothetical protein